MEQDIGIPAETIQVVQHLPSRLEPVHRVLLHCFHGDLFQAPGNRRVQLPGHHRFCLELHQGHRYRVIRDKRKPAGKHLIEHDTHGVDIGFIGDIVAPGLFRRDVMHRTNGFVRHGLCFTLQESGNAEIGHFNGAVLQQHDVLGFDITVDDPLFMGALQGHQNLAGEVESFLPADGPLLLNILLEGDAIDKLHDDILDLIAKAHVIDLDNIGMVQHRNCLGLVPETAEKIAVVGELFLEDFNGYPTAFHPVISLVHIGHAPHADELVDLVPAIQALSNESIHKQLPTFL